MDTFDTRAWLAALLGHLNTHPQLSNTMLRISSNDAEVQVSGNLAALAAWTATLGDVQPITITAVGNTPFENQMRADGLMADQTRVKVVLALGSAEECDQLAERGFLREHLTFPVEVLHRLVEQVAA